MESDDRRSGYARIRRLHPASLFFTLARHAKALLVPGLLVLLVAGDGWEAWLMLLFLPIALHAVVRYLTVRYRFGVGELVVTDGILHRNERHVPFGRIQNIDLVQNVFHRLVNVAVVRIETASGQQAEAEFEVLTLRAVEEMRSRVFAEQRSRDPELAGDESETVATLAADSGAGPEDPATPLVELGLPELVRLGLIANRGVAMVAAAFAAAWQFELLERLAVADWLEQVLDSTTMVRLVIAAVVLTVVGIVLLFALSVAWTLLRFWGFRLEAVGDDLRLEAGLLTRVSATIPRRRIQFVSVEETLVHRLLGRVSVRIETAGAGEGEKLTGISRKHFVPILPASELADLLVRVHPALRFDAVEWRPLARGALARMVRKGLMLSLFVTVGLVFAVGLWGLLAPVALAPVVVFAARRAAAYGAWAETSWGVLFRSGVLTRRCSATLFEKVQTVTLSHSPFDRRWGMACVAVDTAGAGAAEHKIRIGYIEAPEAVGLHERLAAAAGDTELRW